MSQVFPFGTAPQFSTHSPLSNLAPFVRRILHGWWDSKQPYRFKIPPTGGIFLSYIRGAPLQIQMTDRVWAESPRFFIGGQLRRERPILESSGRFDLIGVEFTPTGFYRLFHVDAEQFTDRMTDFAQTCPAQAMWLNERLSHDTGVEESLRILQDLLRSLIPGARDAESNCGITNAGQIFRSISLNRSTIRLNRAKNLPCPRDPSLRTRKSDRLLE